MSDQKKPTTDAKKTTKTEDDKIRENLLKKQSETEDCPFC